MTDSTRTVARVPARRPCGSCPYRRDVPSGIWDEEEYAKLSAYDEPETVRQPPAAFMCHQQNGRLCAGWVAVHNMQESLGLRLVAALSRMSLEEVDATIEYTTDVPLFGSGSEAALHGLAEVKCPSESALRLIERLRRRRVAA